jgi:Cytochrome oxidase maturation protein cbb3-type
VEVIVILVFISLVLVVGALLFFIISVRQGDLEHGDRLTLLPLEQDDSTEPEGIAHRPREEGVRSDD